MEFTGGEIRKEGPQRRSGTGVEAVLIAGPTASGKSALALAYAERVGALIVNADSMQVYRDLAIITNRPSAAEAARAPHRLFGHVDGAVNYSVARYIEDAGAVVAEAAQARRPVVFVGGTGLYFKALLEGLSEVPPVPEAIRAGLRRDTEGLASEDLHARLSALDPEGAARLQPNDRLRVIRALEVLAATGRPLRGFQGRKANGPLADATIIRKIFVEPDRAALRTAIDGRFQTMIAAGALQEVAALAERGLDPLLPVMRAHGVPALIAHLRGEIPLEEAIRQGQADTRRYAKRQWTWARHQMTDWERLGPAAAHSALEATG